MEVKQIKDLMAAMGRTGVKRLAIKREGFELELERETNEGSSRLAEQVLELVEDNPMRSELELHRAQGFLKRRNRDGEAQHKEDISNESSAEPAAPSEAEGEFITAPIVGTFYLSPSPEDPAFTKVGDRVEADTIVCIVEAMKVMNEVKAGISGVVAEILVGNGQPIEFGTNLFRIITE